MDGGVDEFKKEARFQPGDIVLDPFCGSGTTLVQANELGMHAVGGGCVRVQRAHQQCEGRAPAPCECADGAEQHHASLRLLSDSTTIPAFEARLSEDLSAFNRRFFTVPRIQTQSAPRTDQREGVRQRKSDEFTRRFLELTDEYGVQILQDGSDRFLEKWFLQPVRVEIDLAAEAVKRIADESIRHLAELILSRTVRTCRATTHADLATLKEPVSAPYYCAKHGKVCRPLFSMLGWWTRYCQDTLQRLDQFNQLRTDTLQVCLVGDSRAIDLEAELARRRRLWVG